MENQEIQKYNIQVDSDCLGNSLEQCLKYCLHLESKEEGSGVQAFKEISNGFIKQEEHMLNIIKYNIPFKIEYNWENC